MSRPIVSDRPRPTATDRDRPRPTATDRDQPRPTSTGRVRPRPTTTEPLLFSPLSYPPFPSLPSSPLTTFGVRRQPPVRPPLSQRDLTLVVATRWPLLPRRRPVARGPGLLPAGDYVQGARVPVHVGVGDSGAAVCGAAVQRLRGGKRLLVVLWIVQVIWKEWRALFGQWLVTPCRIICSVIFWV